MSSAIGVKHTVDDHAAHLAAGAGAEDDSVPLMSAETFPRLAGGIRAALQETDLCFSSGMVGFSLTGHF